MGGKSSREVKAALGDHEKQIKEDVAKAAGKANGHMTAAVNGVVKSVVPEEEHTAACKCNPCNCNPCKCKEEAATNVADKQGEEPVKTESSESERKQCSDECKCNPCNCQECKCADGSDSNRDEQNVTAETAPPSEVAAHTEEQPQQEQAQTEQPVAEPNPEPVHQEQPVEHQVEEQSKSEPEQQQSVEPTHTENHEQQIEATNEGHQEHQVQEHHQ